MVQPAFAALLARKLAPGGMLHMATDWPEYAAHMLSVLGQDPDFEPAPAGLVSRPATKFETRGRGLGHEIHELCFRRRGSAPAPR
jgi:tRNA (guanine-N7-)-methyltransferase